MDFFLCEEALNEKRILRLMDLQISVINSFRFSNRLLNFHQRQQVPENTSHDHCKRLLRTRGLRLMTSLPTLLENIYVDGQ